MVYRFWRSSEDIMTGEVKYTSPNINAPLLSGLALKAFVWLLETPFLGSSILSFFMWKNKFKQTFIESVIPELPMFLPEYPEQNKEVAVKQLAEAEEPPLRVAAALDCLPRVHVLRQQENDGAFPFLYWTIRDYAEAYRTGRTTPSLVAEEFIAAVEDSQKRSPPMEFFRSFFPEDIRKQAAVSTRRFVEGVGDKRWKPMIQVNDDQSYRSLLIMVHVKRPNQIHNGGPLLSHHRCSLQPIILQLPGIADERWKTMTQVNDDQSWRSPLLMVHLEKPNQTHDDGPPRVQVHTF